jgi:hypothetical protein
MTDEERRRIALAMRLRDAAARAEARALSLQEHAYNARMLADELESDRPPTREQLIERGLALFKGERI